MTDILSEHLGYVSDTKRLALYREAIRRVLRPSDVVADLGCGTAVLGVSCLKAGASRIHAIDESDALELARESLKRAGLQTRARFVESSTFHAVLPEQVDLLICDHVGFFGVDYGLVELMGDARRRFLKPGGNMIPGRLKVFVGAVNSESCHRQATAWGDDAVPEYLRWIRELGVHTRYAHSLAPENIVSDVATLDTIDLRQDHPSLFSWSAVLTVESTCELHGLAGWFDCELAEGVWMTNSPLSDERIRRPQAFLPLSTTLFVTAGDHLRVRLMLRPSDNLLTWELRHEASGKLFKHSTWQGLHVSSEQLRRQLPAYVPTPNQGGNALVAVLQYVDGKRSVSEINALVDERHPDLFPSKAETRRFVSRVLSGYTQ